GGRRRALDVSYGVQPIAARLFSISLELCSSALLGARGQRTGCDGYHQHGENCDGISSQGEIEVEIRVGKQIIADQNADQGGKNAVEIPLCHSCDEKYRQDKEHGDKVILRVKPLEGKAKPGYT